MVERTVEQINSDNAQGFLLFDVVFVQHPHMNDDLIWSTAWLGLETDSEPTIRFVVLFKTARGNGTRENEEGAGVAEFLVEPLNQEVVLMIEHRVKPNATDIPIGW